MKTIFVLIIMAWDMNGEYAGGATVAYESALDCQAGAAYAMTTAESSINTVEAACFPTKLVGVRDPEAN